MGCRKNGTEDSAGPGWWKKLHWQNDCEVLVKNDDASETLRPIAIMVRNAVTPDITSLRNYLQSDMIGMDIEDSDMATSVHNEYHAPYRSLASITDRDGFTEVKTYIVIQPNKRTGDEE